MITEIGIDIEKAVQLLKRGELVAVPTETVYGLAANALDHEAVIKIYEAKQRPRFNPLIIHLPSLESAAPYVKEIPGPIRILANRFSPGPISYLLPKTDKVPDLVTAGSNKVVLRIPAHPMTIQVLEKLDFPIAAPSANPFGYVSPVTAQHVMQGLDGKIPYILDGGSSTIGLESTIVGIEEGNLVIYRLGGVTAEQIEEATGLKPLFSLLHKKPDTPGQLKSHYAPATPLIVGDVENNIKFHQHKRIAVISFQKQYPNVSINKTLSPAGDLHEAAQQLFTALRELDQSDAEIILAEKFPNTGIGMAINDRLSRATH